VLGSAFIRSIASFKFVVILFVNYHNPLAIVTFRQISAHGSVNKVNKQQVMVDNCSFIHSFIHSFVCDKVI